MFVLFGGDYVVVPERTSAPNIAESQKEDIRTSSHCFTAHAFKCS